MKCLNNPLSYLFSRRCGLFLLFFCFGLYSVHAAEKNSQEFRYNQKTLENYPVILEYLIDQDVFYKACKEVDEVLSEDTAYAEGATEERAGMRWKELHQILKREQKKAAWIVLKQSFFDLLGTITSFLRLGAMVVLAICAGVGVVYGLFLLDILVTPKVASFLGFDMIYDSGFDFWQNQVLARARRVTSKWAISRSILTKLGYDMSFSDSPPNLMDTKTPVLEGGRITTPNVTLMQTSDIEKRVDEAKKPTVVHKIANNGFGGNFGRYFVLVVLGNLGVFVWERLKNFYNQLTLFIYFSLDPGSIRNPLKSQQRYYIEELHTGLPEKAKKYLHGLFREAYLHLLRDPMASSAFLLKLDSALDLLVPRVPSEVRVPSASELKSLTKYYEEGEEMYKTLRRMCRQIKSLNDRKGREVETKTGFETGGRIVVVFDGPPGTGKTRMVTELMNMMGLSPVVVQDHRKVCDALMDSKPKNELKVVFGDDLDRSINALDSISPYELSLLNRDELYLEDAETGRMFAAPDVLIITANNEFKFPAAKDRVSLHVSTAAGIIQGRKKEIAMGYLEYLVEHDGQCRLDDFSQEELDSIVRFIDEPVQKSKKTLRSLIQYVEQLYIEKIIEVENSDWVANSASPVFSKEQTMFPSQQDIDDFRLT